MPEQDDDDRRKRRSDDRRATRSAPSGASPGGRSKSGRARRGTLVQLRPPRVGAWTRSEETAARKRVAALVSGGLHFHVKRDGDRISGARGGVGPKLTARLSGKTFQPEQTLDLRAHSSDQLREPIDTALPLAHRRGIKHMLIAFASVASSEQPREPRVQALIDALTRGPAAPLVRAFASAHENLGGVDVLAVLLI